MSWRKDSTIMTTLSISLVLDSDGLIDETASTLAFQAAVADYKAQRELEEGTIAEAVAAQFDKYPGASQNMPALVSGVLHALNVQPSNFKTMETKVLHYIRENSDRPADKKLGREAEPPRTRLFGIRKGVGGGVCRWSDVPEKADKA
jgi:hypothetical protein